MSTQHDDIVRVALLGLGDDVPGLAVLGKGIYNQCHLDGLVTIDELLPLSALLEGNDSDRGQGTVVLSAEGGRRDIRSRHVVDQHGTKGTLVLGDLELVGDGADTTLDECNLAIDVNALPLLLEAARTLLIVNGDGHEGASDTIRQRGWVVVLQRDDVDIVAIRAGQRDGVGRGEEVGEGLNKGVEVLAEAGDDALQNEVERGIVARGAKGTVAAIVASNLVEVPEDILKPGTVLVRIDND